MKKNAKLLLGLGAGYLVLTHINRPANVRGNDPGFDWQGKHIEGGQGSAITNIGSSVKTDYALVAASMINYAADKWGRSSPTPPSVALCTWGYALEVLDYWVKEVARFGPTLTMARQSVFNDSAMRMVIAQSALGVSSPGNMTLVSTGWPRFINALPAYLAYDWYVKNGLISSTDIFGRRPARMHADSEMMSVADAKTLWSAVSNVGINFDYTKATPTKDTVWTAGLKAAEDAIKGAPGKALEVVAEGTWWGLKTALQNPLFAALAVGAGYVYWKRRQ